MTSPADFPVLLEGVSIESRFGRSNPIKFAKTLEALDSAEADVVVTNNEFQALKYGLNNALEHAFGTLIGDRYLYAGKSQNLPPTVDELIHEVSYPASHILAGKLKKVEKFQAKVAKGQAPDHEVLGKLYAFYAEAAPLGTRVTVLKDKIGKRKPAPTKTSIARDERDAKAMTCQCCGRGILAETGLIAHHGYQRPGDGYQTASCFGALALPFEVSRARLADYIISLKGMWERAHSALDSLQANQSTLMWSFVDITKPRARWQEPEKMAVSVTFETFDTVKAETAEFRNPKDGTTYAELRDRRIAQVQAEIRSIHAEITLQQGRFAGWKQTHERKGDEWVALEV